MAITLTPKIIWAAAADAGNRSMRRAGRTAWNEDDYNAAAREFDRLVEFPREDGEPGRGLFDRRRGGAS